MAPEDFVDLELQHQEKHFRVQRSATLTDKVMRRSALTGMTRPADPSVLTVDPLSCRPKWKWPEEEATSVPEFWRTRMNDLPQRSWNVVPFRALVYAFVMDADARKIFGRLGLTWLKTEVPYGAFSILRIFAPFLLSLHPVSLGKKNQVFFVSDGHCRCAMANLRPSAEHFRALKEILLASDTNRLVAELTFAPMADIGRQMQTTSDNIYWD